MNRIPFNDTGRQYRSIQISIDDAVHRVLKSGWYLLGTETERFEEAFARYCGTPHCVTVANGTDALELALRASGCGADAEVVTVANAGGYSTTACRLVGATPVYVDVDPNTFLMDLDAALAAITPSTRAVVATHLYGRMVDVARLTSALEATGRTDISVIEDCAQAHGATLGGARCGSLGHIGAFSFYPTKNLGALGDGGALTCHRADLATLLRRLRQYGWTDKYYAGVPFGRNSRLDELQAAVLLAKLPHLDDWNSRRREIVRHYREAAPENVEVLDATGDSHVAHLAVARCRNRDAVAASLSAVGIDTGIHYPVLDCDQEAMSGQAALVPSPLKQSRAATAQVLTLPCFPEMTDEEVKHVCESLALIQPASARLPGN